MNGGLDWVNDDEHVRKGKGKFCPRLLFPPRGVVCHLLSLWGAEEPPLVQTVAMEHSILQTGSETNRLGRGG